MKSIYYPRKSKVERSQSHDSKDIGRIDDEFILCDSHDRWDTIDCKYEIRCLDKYQTHKQWCPIELRILTDEELITMQHFFKWDNLTNPFYDETTLRVDLHLAT